MAEDVDYMAVASMTDGMVGAELANIVEIAAINMMRDGRTEVLINERKETMLCSFSTLLYFSDLIVLLESNWN